MNVFILDSQHIPCARYMVDSHVVKMPLEHAQLVSTAYRISKFLGYIPRKLTSKEIAELKKTNDIEIIIGGVRIYKATHINHPCSIWARTSRDNCDFLADLSYYIDRERKFRFGSTSPHESVSVSDVIIDCESFDIPEKGVTEFAQAMPDDVKQENVIEAYRDYYRKYKIHLFKWTKRSAPKWIKTPVSKSKRKIRKK